MLDLDVGGDDDPATYGRDGDDDLRDSTLL